jgi:hypothetical protein
LAAATPPPAAEGEEGGAAEPPAPVEGSELIKAKDDSAAVLKVWSSKFGSGPLSSALSCLKKHALPVPAPVSKLLYAVGCLVNFHAAQLTDVCGDPSWEVFQREALDHLGLMIATFNPTEVIRLKNKSNTLAAVKAYCEANAVLDAGAYPVYMSVFSTVLLPWLQKAIAAREAAIACSTEISKTSLETFE